MRGHYFGEEVRGLTKKAAGLGGQISACVGAGASVWAAGFAGLKSGTVLEAPLGRSRAENAEVTRVGSRRFALPPTACGSKEAPSARLLFRHG
jgi:hypothetical protein